MAIGVKASSRFSKPTVSTQTVRPVQGSTTSFERLFERTSRPSHENFTAYLTMHPSEGEHDPLKAFEDFLKEEREELREDKKFDRELTRATAKDEAKLNALQKQLDLANARLEDLKQQASQTTNPVEKKDLKDEAKSLKGQIQLINFMMIDLYDDVINADFHVLERAEERI